MESIMQEGKQLTGSVQLRRGTWHIVLNLYCDKGFRKPKWINTGLPERGNKRNAQKIKYEYIAQYESQQAIPANKVTVFADYVKLWLSSRSGLEQSTWENYENVLKNHLIPYFERSNMPMEAIKPKNIKEYYIHKARDGRKDRKNGGLSHETLKKHASVLNLIFAEALELEEIKSNPAANVSIPRPNVEDKRDVLEGAAFLTAEEANRVLDGFSGDILQPLICVTLYYGLRRSEVLGLKWDVVSFENDTLEIKHTVVKHKTIIAKDRTKSKSSRGTFVLLPEVKDILLSLKEQQDSNKNLFGRQYVDSDYIFTWPDGRLFRPDYLTKRFQTMISQMGLPHMTFHDLRHSCSSILYDKGWNVKDIQEWLRHSKLETTMNIYTHISNQRKTILAKDMQGTFKLCGVSGFNKNQHPVPRSQRKTKSSLQAC